MIRKQALVCLLTMSPRLLREMAEQLIDGKDENSKDSSLYSSLLLSCKNCDRKNTCVCCWTAVCLVFTIEPVDSFLSQGFVMFSNCVFNEGLKPSGAVNVFLFSSHSR